jgi:transposase
MAIKLEKIELASAAEIKELPHEELISLTLKLIERMEYYQGLLYRAKNDKFGSKSEKSPKNPDEKQEGDDGAAQANPKAKRPRTDTTKRPSERYPDAPIKENLIGFTEPPCCEACGHKMEDSGMTEDSEYLSTSPKEYIIIRQKRQKHRCIKCHSSIVTAPSPPRIVPGGTYGDDMIVDATLSKFCDLIPMERYCQMAARRGLLGLPPQSLIEASINLSKFMEPVYQRLKDQTLNSIVLSADETPHKMLEGDEKKRWFLWGFSCVRSCFFECHDTRSGDVSTAVLAKSNCEFLLTDVYSGYDKSVRLANQLRLLEGRPLILHAYCNAHARRKFKERDSDQVCEDAESMVNHYKEIYKLNKESKGEPVDVVLEKRAKMKPIFETMKDEALAKINSYSSKSQMAIAYNYFLENYEGLTRFLDNEQIPIDNNHSERILRSHVIGRKTWYGTHSTRSAESAAIHFSIVETCKMIGVNPREFYLDAVARIHSKRESLTPFEYKELTGTNTG